MTLDPANSFGFGDCDDVAVCGVLSAAINTPVTVRRTQLKVNDAQYARDVGHSVASSDLAITESDVACWAVDNKCRRVRGGGRGESVV